MLVLISTVAVKLPPFCMPPLSPVPKTPAPKGICIVSGKSNFTCSQPEVCPLVFTTCTLAIYSVPGTTFLSLKLPDVTSLCAIVVNSFSLKI